MLSEWFEMPVRNQLEYISSEESDIDENGCREVRELQWESPTLRQLKVKLDVIDEEEVKKDKRLKRAGLQREGHISDRVAPTVKMDWAIL